MEEVIYYYGSGCCYDQQKVDGMNLVYNSGKESKESVYSDRLWQWDHEKYNRCCREVWGNEGQSFYGRSPEDIEKFLRLYLERNDVILCRILQDENHSDGFPYWRFDYTFESE